MGNYDSEGVIVYDGRTFRVELLIDLKSSDIAFLVMGTVI